MEATLTMNQMIRMTEEERAAVSDETILHMAYGIENFSLDGMFTDRDDLARLIQIKRSLKNRLHALESARKEAKQAALGYVKCNCGHMSQHPMSTSSGTACDDCYDRMSW